MAAREPSEVRAGPVTASGPKAVLLLLALAGVSLLSNPLAVLPLRTYYFRDFTTTYYPARVFVGTELAAGRWPLWNPWIHEGTFALGGGAGGTYPLDLLHAFFRGPAAVSWLLTLHLPLAALAAYALARDQGAGRAGSFLAGAAFALGGLMTSAVNVQIPLQGMACGPLVVLALRRAALRGGRWIAAAAAAAALPLSALALEFALQAVVLGTLLALASPSRRAVGRLALALGLGVALAGVPVATVLGVLPQTARGGQLSEREANAYSIHPAGLIQVVLPAAFGAPDRPFQLWWGNRVFPEGLPFFLTLYLGLPILALAWVGLGEVDRRRRVLLAGAAALALWFSFGSWGGLAPVVRSLPVVGWIRYPSKAAFLPYLVVTLLAGLGVDGLLGGRGWPRLRVALGVLMAVPAGVLLAAAGAPAAVSAWMQGPPLLAEVMRSSLLQQSVQVLLLGALGLGLAWAVQARGLPPVRAVGTLATVAVLDLARAGAGVNPQTLPDFYRPLPEMRALQLDRLEGGRVYPEPIHATPAFLEFWQGRRPGSELWTYFLHRQMLNPHSAVLDRVETAEEPDLTSFVPHGTGIPRFEPAHVGDVLPRLRQAAVVRILSLDPLDHPDLPLLARIPAGPPGLAIHVYEVRGSAPRGHVACRLLAAGSAFEARAAALRPEVDPGRDVVLEAPGRATCTSGQARRVEFQPGEELWEAHLDGEGYLVTRDRHASGWQAEVDGHPAPVLRANGRHRAVALPPGSHCVRLRYRAQEAAWGFAAAAGGALATLLLAWRPVWVEPS